MLTAVVPNSFGYGGTNAHVILDTAKDLEVADNLLLASTTETRPRVFMISGASEKSCQKFAADLAEYVSHSKAFSGDQAWLDRLAYTLNRRSVYHHQSAIVANDAEALVSKLQSLSEKPIPRSSGQIKKRVAFVFSGQGAQYYNMGRELLSVYADRSFKSIFDENAGARDLLLLYRRVFGDDSCRVTECINALGIYPKIDCFDVGKYMSESLEKDESTASVRPPEQPPREKPKELISAKESKLLQKGLRADYIPCDHEGPCTKNNGCICIEKGLFCEKFCRCCSPRVSGERTHASNSCRNLYPGCDCETGCKDEDQCICVKAKRECDPDFCKCANWNLARDKTVKDYGCCNSGLRFNRIARIVCGHSEVHGWGVYACAPIPKGTLIGQYTGKSSCRLQAQVLLVALFDSALTLSIRR